ncbi:MAG: hypothetical protein LBU58_08385, partial [Clostridiales bacterium]|nr:hypothetical protein [Clostridiales bacterium]
MKNEKGKNQSHAHGSARRTTQSRKMRRAFSWALVLAMLLSLLPANAAFAAPGDPPSAITAQPPLGVEWTVVSSAAELKTAIEGPALYVKLGADITVPASYRDFAAMNTSKAGAFILDGDGKKLVFIGGHYASTGHIKVENVSKMPSLTVRNIEVHASHARGFIWGGYRGEVNFSEMKFIGPAVSDLTSTSKAVRQNIYNCDITLAIRLNNTTDEYVHVGNNAMLATQVASTSSSGTGASTSGLSSVRTAPAFSSRFIEFFGDNTLVKPHTNSTGYQKIFYLGRDSSGAVFRVAEGATLDIEDQSHSRQGTYPNGLFNSANNRSIVTVAERATFNYRNTGDYGGVIVRGNTAAHFLASFTIEKDATVNFALKTPG